MSNTISLGGTIRYFRKRKGLTLRELSKKTNISPIYISELENGKKKNPSEEILYKIICGLNLTQDDMLELFDGYTLNGDIISSDIAEYIMNNQLVQIALRVALDNEASRQDWINFIIKIKKNRR